MLNLDMVNGMTDDIVMVEKYFHEYLKAEGAGEPLRQTLQQAASSGGKRLRPIMVLLSARFGTGYEARRERLCKIGALVEMIHLASLVHDDIIDDSPLRRGKPTVQSMYGKDMAVYTGDFILSRMMQNMLQEGLWEEGLVLSRCVGEMCAGEVNQYENQFSVSATKENYFESICGKTAAIFAASCKIGASQGGCGEADVRRLEQLGSHFGVIFQLQDDLNDFMSGEDKEGKPVHVDFKTGIYTLPVLHGFEHPEYGERLRKLAVLAAGGAEDRALIEEMEYLVKKSGGVDYTKDVLGDYGIKAGQILEQLRDCDANRMVRKILKLIN